jgi:hypothetical protein
MAGIGAVLSRFSTLQTLEVKKKNVSMRRGAWRILWIIR